MRSEGEDKDLEAVNMDMTGLYDGGCLMHDMWLSRWLIELIGERVNMWLAERIICCLRRRDDCVAARVHLLGD